MDPFKEYEHAANTEFINLNPKIQADFLLYATNPDLKFGKTIDPKLEGGMYLK